MNYSYCEKMKNKLNHVGVIIDGTRRFARENKMPLRKVYELGAKKLYNAIKWLFSDFDVNEVTIYAFSYDNLQRTSKERDAVFDVQEKEFSKWLADPFFKNIQVNFVGEYTNIPYSLFMVCGRLEEETKKNKGKKLNILMGYLGYREVANAVRKVLMEEDWGNLAGILKMGTSDTITILSDRIQEKLDITTPIDLLIRTGGESRTSGFPPWQLQYAELCFIDKYWPAIEKKDIVGAINDYSERERRKGE